MAIDLDFKEVIDVPAWDSMCLSLNAMAAGSSLQYDRRNNEDAHPNIFQLVSATVLNEISPRGDGPQFIGSPALTGTFGAGAGCVFMPSMGPRGAIAAGATTQSIVLSTALAAAVGVNQLASRRGTRRGFKMRIIDNGSGGTGKTEERLIVANTSGTAPTVYLDSALSFTPVVNSTYEILAGRLYMLSAGTLAAGMWKYYDVATNSFSGNLATTNLPATVGTDASFVGKDELIVPHTRAPGDGVLGILTATAVSSTTLTGQATGGDAVLTVNQYRNFQLRIVEDTVNVTAVGQRRKITSHTVGASPVYTVPAWTVTPSPSAKYVIELCNEILLWSSGATATYTYAPIAIGGMTADTWSTSIYAARPEAMGAGCCSFISIGIDLTTNPGALNKHSNVFSLRGAATTTLHVLDIAGGATGVWTTEAYAKQSATLSTGGCGAYDPCTNEGRYYYFTVGASQQFLRFDCLTRNVEPWAYLLYAQSTAVVGERLAIVKAIDGSTKLGVLWTIRSSGTETFRSYLWR